jgi:WD40 repeat protein
VWDAESGKLHRELESFEGPPVPERQEGGRGARAAARGDPVMALASFLSPDGRQPRLAAGSCDGHVWVYDPEAGSVLHRLQGRNSVKAHEDAGIGLACIASSSAAPHHPRLVSTSVAENGPARVWDGETGEMLARLGGMGGVRSVAVWKEHRGGHDRIATVPRKADHGSGVTVWDGEAFKCLRDLAFASTVLVCKSAEGPARLLLGQAQGGLQVWDPEEGRRLAGGIHHPHAFDTFHLFESAQGRHLLATVSRGNQHPRHPGGVERFVLDVWDLGEAPACTPSLRGAHHTG